MHYGRKLLVAALCALLPLTLFGFGLLFSLHQALGNPDNVKGALRESGIYNSAVSDLLNQKESSTDPGTTDEIPTDRPEVKDAIEKAFPPATVEDKVNAVLDGTYAWIRGDTEQLQFEVDLSDARIELANNLGAYARARAATLPDCPASQPITADFDVFNATCKPAGVDLNLVEAQAKHEVLTSDLLDNSTITANNLTDEAGRTLDERLKGVPQAYSKLVTGLYLSGAMAIALMAGAIFLSPSRRSGSRRVAIIVLGVGVSSTVLAWVSSFVANQLAENISKNDISNSLQTSLLEIVRILVHDIRIWWMGFGILLIALAAGSLLTLHFAKPKGPHDPKADEGREKREEAGGTDTASKKPPQAITN